MVRKLLAGMLLGVSVLSAGLGWQAYAGASAPRTESGDVVLPVLSPRRVPVLASSMPQEASIRDAASAAIDQLSKQGVCVAIERNGRVVFTRDANSPYLPASTAKLLTGAAALFAFDDGKTFRTTVAADNKPKNGEINGPLYLIGGGDPLLMTDDFVANTQGHRDVHTSMEKLADQIVSAGVKSVRGDIVGDDSRFDRLRYGPTWEAGYRSEGQVGPIGALTVNEGFRIDRGARVAVDDPAANAADVLAGLLRGRGVRVDGAARSGDAPAKGLDVLVRFDSLPVEDIVKEMLTESDNTTAEVLTKNLGVEKKNAGTWAAGTQAIVDTLSGAGVDIRSLHLADGSGLDRANRVTCETLAKVLALTGQRGPIADGLPKAGETGTLTNRFVGTPAVGRLQAKTGTLSGVTALAGWAHPDGQDAFSFAVITNNLPEDVARRLEESIGVLLAGQAPATSMAAYAPSGLGK